MPIEKSRISYLNQDGEIDRQVARTEDAFLHNEAGFTAKDVREVALSLAKEITRILQTTNTPGEQSEMILYILNAREISNALFRSKKYSLKLQRAPRPMYDGDTYEYVKALESAVAIDEKNDRDGIRVYTVTWIDQHGTPHTEELNIAELEQYLHPIRLAILEELKNHIDPRAFHFVEKELSRDGRVTALHDDKVLKLAFDHHQYLDGQRPEDKRQRNEALVSLFHISERSPYIAYQVLSSDFDTTPHEGLEIHRLLPMQTLDQILLQKPLPHFSTVLGYFTDAMRGAEFLVSHHLRLTDLAPHNIAVNTETDTGMFFDYDGLRLDHQEMEGYMTHMGYVPPERRPQRPDGEPESSKDLIDIFAAMHGSYPPQIKKPVTEAEMVFEMGVTLKTICSAYPDDFENIRDIAETMTSPDPDHRPTFAKILDKLTSLHARRAA